MGSGMRSTASYMSMNAFGERSRQTTRIGHVHEFVGRLLTEQRVLCAEELDDVGVGGQCDHRVYSRSGRPAGLARTTSMQSRHRSLPSLGSSIDAMRPK